MRRGVWGWLKCLANTRAMPRPATDFLKHGQTKGDRGAALRDSRACTARRLMTFMMWNVPCPLEGVLSENHRLAMVNVFKERL